MDARHLFPARELCICSAAGLGVLRSPVWPPIRNGPSNFQKATYLHGMMSQLEFSFYYCLIFVTFGKSLNISKNLLTFLQFQALKGVDNNRQGACLSDVA